MAKYESLEGIQGFLYTRSRTIFDDKIATEKSRKINEKFIHVNGFKKAMALAIKRALDIK